MREKAKDGLLYSYLLSISANNAFERQMRLFKNVARLFQADLNTRWLSTFAKANGGTRASNSSVVERTHTHTQTMNIIVDLSCWHISRYDSS